ncbi:MAG: SRPBCC family protein [Actinomycetes bacterium]
MSEYSESSIVIAASVSEVEAVLFDLANYPSWSTAIKSAEVLETNSDSRVTKIRTSIDGGVLRDNVTLEYDWSGAPGRLSFSLEDADLLTEMSGAYTIESLDDDETKVTYQLKVGISMPVPAMMRQKAEKSSIELALSQLKSKIEN